MKEATKKCFNILHEKMLDSTEYKAGYQFGRQVRSILETLTVDALVGKRHLYISSRTPYAAGVARAVLEVIWEHEAEKVAA